MKARHHRSGLHQVTFLLVSLCVWILAHGTGQAEERHVGDEAVVKLVIHSGHSDLVNSAVFAPDGRTILTGSSDRTACLWDVATGRELRRFEGHTSGVWTAVFDPDGRSILTAGSEDDTARLWDVVTGQELRRFEGHTHSVTSAVFAPDGRTILTGSADKTARLWDVVTGQELRRFKGHTVYVNSAVFAPDGRTILTASADGTARLWDLATGQELRRFAGHTDEVKTAVFAPDGRSILTASVDNTARLWDLATGQELRRFAVHTTYMTSAVFAPDGRAILTASFGGILRLWDVVTGQELRRFEVRSSYGWVTHAVFAPDGRTILTTDGSARLWDLATGQELRRFEGHAHQVRSALFAPDGRSILTASGDNTVRLWDVVTGQQLRRFEGHTAYVNSAVFAPDGRTILTGSADKTARLWDVATGRELRRFEGHTAYVNSAVFAPDGRTILTASWDHTARLWDLATGRELRRFEGEERLLLPMTSAVFAPDGRSILTAGGDYTARLWDPATGQELRRFEGHTQPVLSAGFAPDGRTILTTSYDRTVRQWDLATGRELHRFEGHTQPVSSAAFAPDGRAILTASADGTARLWDVVTGQELRRFAGHTHRLRSAVFAPDSRTVLTVSEDSTTRFWHVQDSQELARFVSFTDGTWAVVDREGRFDGSNGGDLASLHWVMGLEWIGLNQLKDRYYEPGLLAKKLGFNPDPLRPVERFTAPALYPEITLNQPSINDPVLRVMLMNRGGGIGRVMVTINGKEMTADARPRGSNHTAASLNVELPLAAYQRWLKDGKQNSIEVRAYNAEGYLVSRAAQVLYEPPGTTTLPEITLRAVIVGVSDYAGDELDLRYAAKDAEDMAKAVELGGRRLFGADHVQIRLLTTTQADPQARPTKANIKTAFEALGDAKPDDILFVYFSGHGVAVQDVYHYPTQEALTTNLEDPAVRAERSVSSEEIAQWLKQSPATQRQVLVLDTCAAGAAAKSLVEHRNVPSDQIRALERLKDRTGVHVLMGSAADRVSWEATQFEQGLLTHALLRGMKGAALRDDSYIDVSRLFNYVADEVPKLAVQVGGIQRPHIATPRATNVESFDIGQLTNADRNAIPLRNPKPLLLRPTLLNGQSAFDDLSLEPKLRARLREESFARTRGRESAVVFVEADELPGAVKPSGLYSVDGSRLRAKMILRRDDITKEIQVEGTRTDLEGFIEKTVQAVTRAVEEWK